jgi:ParB/RepB/Spo0J family partition protein
MSQYVLLPIKDIVPLMMIRALIEPLVKLLMASIEEIGQLQPILCCPHPDINGKYGLIAGLHRFEAMSRNGATQIAAHLFPPGLSITQMMVMAMAENNAKANMNFAEKADILLRIVEEEKCTYGEAGNRCGITKPAEITACITARKNLRDDVMLDLANANIGSGTAYFISGFPHDTQRVLADMALSGATREQIKAEGKRLNGDKPKVRMARILLEFPRSDGFPGAIAMLKDKLADVLRVQKQFPDKFDLYF